MCVCVGVCVCVCVCVCVRMSKCVSFLLYCISTFVGYLMPKAHPYRRITVVLLNSLLLIKRVLILFTRLLAQNERNGSLWVCMCVCACVFCLQNTGIH